MACATEKILSLEFKEETMSDSEKSTVYRTINSNIISLLSYTKGLDMTTASKNCEESINTETILCLVADNAQSILHDFFWLSRCCSLATEIVDTFNSMHVAGILAVKSLYVLSLYNPEYHLEATKIKDIFPNERTIHVSQKCILKVKYSEFVYILTNIQQYWDVLVKLDSIKACHLLVLCMTRFGFFCSHQLSEGILDDIQEREDIGSSKKIFVISKLCCRNLMNTFVCMARDLSIYHNSIELGYKYLDEDESKQFIAGEFTKAITILPQNVHHSIESCFMKIQQNKMSSLKNDNIAVLKQSIQENPVKLWEFLSQELGECSMGEPPRKISEKLRELLQDSVIAISSEYNTVNNNTVTASCINVIKTALEFFYIVPSADKFREINLMQEVCPGQRLNYAHDFVHFDTGQLSQVVYLHNSKFKAKPAPSCITDWTLTEVAGPIAAFLQLVPDLQIWLSDSDDPIGILSDLKQITKPDLTKNSQPLIGNTTSTHQFNQKWAMVVNKNDAFLVDRENIKIYKSPESVKFHHKIFTLLVLYLRKNNQFHGICTLAINALKINH